MDFEKTSVIKVPILGSNSIHIGYHLLDHICNEIVTFIPASSYTIITDNNVARLHLNTLKRALSEAILSSTISSIKSVKQTSIPIHSFVISPGEGSKTREVKASIEDYMLDNNCTRDACIIALGGGVVGDLAGFVAATYMRGIKFIQIPTTLLAMVDSSIGGKTAVDTHHGKNLIGAFHQPDRIFIDVMYLQTLPKREFCNGMAEVIKTSIIWSEDDFKFLERHASTLMKIADGESIEDPEYSTSMQLLVAAILASVRVKAHVVSNDERESGLRSLVNFGHSIGHAIEGILTPQILHGEAVAIGMVKEAEISRSLGYINQVGLSRLIRCLESYDLPVSLDSKWILSLPQASQLNVTTLMQKLSVDKKNLGGTKRIVLLSSIGATVEEKASVVEDNTILHVLSPSKIIRPTSTWKTRDRLHINVPGSKSISNRALLMAALGKGTCRIEGLLHSDDTHHMINALQSLEACSFEWEDNGNVLIVHGGEGKINPLGKTIFLGNAGTAARFLTSVCCLPTSGPSTSFTCLTGNDRMQERPIGPLVESLQSLGGLISYQNRKGSLPLKISPATVKSVNTIKLKASISSQYVSSLLMVLPYLAKDSISLDLSDDNVVSQPYIEMTLNMMKQFGISVEVVNQHLFRVHKGVYMNPKVYRVEGDASSATYPLALAAITGNTVTVGNVGGKSLQGDAQFAQKVLKPMGCNILQTDSTTTVSGPPLGQLISIPTINMENMTDAFLTAAVLAAVAKNSEGTNTSEIVGISNQRVKECNRIAAMVSELRKFGVVANELADGISVKGVQKISQLRGPSVGVHCYDDHRIAMSFSILGSVVPNFTLINDKKCVEKTWPTWWESLEKDLGIIVEPYSPDYEKEICIEKNTVSRKESCIFIGMRGVGKTTVGRGAASGLKMGFIDLDEELESKVCMSITDYIQQNGWEKFRDIEAVVFLETLANNPFNTIIATGGGIVERSGCREILKRLKHRVVHINRRKEDVFRDLQIDKTRPCFNQDIKEVWEKREPLYQECSGYEFFIIEDSHQGTYVISEMTTFLNTTVWGSKDLPFDSVNLPKHDTVIASTFFLSCTYPDVRDIKQDIDLITEGVDAIELRVDLLKSQASDFVREQVAHLRRFTSLPIIFTVRTQGQGGQFPNNMEKEEVALLLSAIRWGCKFVDIEILISHKDQEIIRESAKNCNIIASYHSISTNKTVLTVEEVVERASKIGDIIKYVSVPCSFEDNLDILEMSYHRSAFSGLFQGKPVIAINMGTKGQMTRVLNRYLTPVTHEILPSKAASGQLSVETIMELRNKLGLVPARKFYLFGTPISHSLSPLMHNTGFLHWKLPYVYNLHETDDLRTVEKVLFSSDFGGASVTMPLKESIISQLDELSIEAQEIGAVNTICVLKSKDHSGRRLLKGYNTDWLGIQRSIESRLSKRRIQSSPQAALVIGAGGTSRAAIYALQALKVPVIYVYNRTEMKAQDLSRQFNVSTLSSLSQILSFDIIISTIPAEAQLKGFERMEHFFNQSDASQGIFVELAYKPRRTYFIDLAEKAIWHTVTGVEILIQQGLEQFRLWTGKNPPLTSIGSKVLAAYTLETLNQS